MKPGTIKWFNCDARPTPKPRPRPEYWARGRVWRQGRTWFYEVRVGDRVVFADNTNDFRRILDDCNRDVVVADRVVRSGHGFRRTCDELVGRAR